MSLTTACDPEVIRKMWTFPKIRVSKKWMVKIMENPIKMDDLGGKPNYFQKHPCPYEETYRQPTPLVLDHLNSVSNPLAEDIPWKNPGS